METRSWHKSRARSGVTIWDRPLIAIPISSGEGDAKSYIDVTLNELSFTKNEHGTYLFDKVGSEHEDIGILLERLRRCEIACPFMYELRA